MHAFVFVFVSFFRRQTKRQHERRNIMCWEKKYDQGKDFWFYQWYCQKHLPPYWPYHDPNQKTSYHGPSPNSNVSSYYAAQHCCLNQFHHFLWFLVRSGGTIVEYWFVLRLTKTSGFHDFVSNVYKKCKFHVERAEQTDYQEGQQHGTASPDCGALSTQHWNQCEHWALARAHCGGNLVCTEHPQEHPGTPEIVSYTHCVHIRT